MQTQIDNVISNITPPDGWEVASDFDEKNGAVPQLSESLQKRISFHLPYIAHNVELYIDQVYKHYNIVIPEAYISIDDDSTFHIVLLINQEDNHTPELIAAKVYAEQFLTTIGAISMRMRYTFTIGKEYFRFHYIENSYKLKYVYKPDKLLLPRTGLRTAL